MDLLPLVTTLDQALGEMTEDAPESSSFLLCGEWGWKQPEPTSDVRGEPAPPALAALPPAESISQVKWGGERSGAQGLQAACEPSHAAELPNKNKTFLFFCF